MSAGSSSARPTGQQGTRGTSAAVLCCDGWRLWRIWLKHWLSRRDSCGTEGDKEGCEGGQKRRNAEREESRKRKREESAAKGPTAYKKLKELGLQSLKRWEMESIALHYFDHELAAKNKDGANTKNAERRAELQELMRDKAHMLPQPPRAKRARKTPAHLVDEYHSIGILS